MCVTGNAVGLKMKILINNKLNGCLTINMFKKWHRNKRDYIPYVYCRIFVGKKYCDLETFPVGTIKAIFYNEN